VVLSLVRFQETSNHDCVPRMLGAGLFGGPECPIGVVGQCRTHPGRVFLEDTYGVVTRWNVDGIVRGTVYGLRYDHGGLCMCMRWYGWNS